MVRVDYDGNGYTCPICGGMMLALYGNEWERSDCDIIGVETWDEEEHTGYLDIDEEAWEQRMEEAREDEEEELRKLGEEWNDFLKDRRRR